MSGPSLGGRQPIPPGTVSRIRGRFQAPALRWLTIGLVVLGLAAAVVGGDAQIVLATVAVGLVIAAPMARVAWLVLRWGQERDARHVALGVGLLSVVAVGVVLAALGVG